MGISPGLRLNHFQSADRFRDFPAFSFEIHKQVYK